MCAVAIVPQLTETANVLCSPVVSLCVAICVCIKAVMSSGPSLERMITDTIFGLLHTHSPTNSHANSENNRSYLYHLLT